MEEIKHSSFRLPPVAKARLASMADEDETSRTALLTRLVNDEWRRRDLEKRGVVLKSGRARR
ncbi:MAG: hypothetical protein Q8P41_31790 [Pseudomonadota bacterium]|nr:hypothetical protein [Pseudomonadota bacterium]